MGGIVVSGLGKAYRQYPNRWSRLAEWVLPFSRPRHTLHWVLRDISFHVESGEAVGIIGINGAGKSTLLKMITGTSQPTTGTVEVSGRISALLELGMGFHPEFTGRQNVFMAGQLLGLTADEIAVLMPEIEAFAGIGEYVDQPVRVYSSGMQVRLAFAVATAKRPDILIVDEALAVGDAAFQRKCFQRIEAFRVSGTTLLFVSHDIDTVKRLCNAAIFLKSGTIHKAGKAKDVCDSYEEHLFGGQQPSLATVKAEQPVAFLDPSLNAASIEKQYGDGGARIVSVLIESESGKVINVIAEGTGFFVTYMVDFATICNGVKFGMMIKTVDGVPVYGTNTIGWAHQEDFSREQRVRVRFALHGNLVPGTYYLNVGVTHESDDGPVFLHRRVDCMIFRVTSMTSRVALGYANLYGRPHVELAPKELPKELPESIRGILS